MSLDGKMYYYKDDDSSHINRNWILREFENNF